MRLDELSVLEAVGAAYHGGRRRGTAKPYDNGTWRVVYRLAAPFVEIYGAKRPSGS